MNNDDTAAVEEKKVDAFEAIASSMVKFRSDMEHFDVAGTRMSAP